jgi:hypothetical protein
VSSLQQHGFVAGVEDVPDFFDLRSAELAGTRIGRAELKGLRIPVVNQQTAKIFPGMRAQSVVEGAAENRRSISASCKPTLLAESANCRCSLSSKPAFKPGGRLPSGMPL